MGNEGSMLPGLELNPKPLENTDEWALHSATSNCTASPNLSVFCGRQGGSNALEQSIKNLRIYRHPNILKYISSWTNQGQLCMATENVRPLNGVLGDQTILEICLGLHDILKALIFLHEKAQCSHNNVCCASVYVTADGSWKLGGLDFLTRFSELTPDVLQKTRARRYEKAVPPEEDSNKTVTPVAIDKYAFGVLVEDIFQRIRDDVQVPGFKEFREISRKQLQNTEPSLRPNLSQLLTQPIFNHRFVIVHEFLSELPLKSDDEKSSFFRGLVDQLREFPEVLLASQLSALLLSRLVILDKTAQQYVIPMLLQPQNDLGPSSTESLFSMSTFQQHIVPRLLHMLSVRDAQIRLLLLEHFEKYCIAFSKEQLCSKVLPELLVGIKDTNDSVVSNTLKALAALVPILGAATVIGGKRARLFTDGRPKEGGLLPKTSETCIEPSRHRMKERTKPSVAQEVQLPICIAELPERPSPDGGEDVVLASQLDEETDNWSDWDLNESQASYGVEDALDLTLSVPLNTAEGTSSSAGTILSSPSSVAIAVTRPDLPDITSLDIKSSVVPNKKSSVAEEIDFFQDMEPVISKPKLLHLGDWENTENASEISAPISCFDVDLTAGPISDNGGWGDNEDWGDISDSELTKV